MAGPDRSAEAHRELVDSSRGLAEYAGSPASRALVRLLDALEASYLIDLRDVAEPGLVRLQSAIRQTCAIRDIAEGGQDILPKI